MAVIFLGPTLIEAGQTKTLSYVPTEIDPPFRAMYLTVPRALDGINEMMVDDIRVRKCGEVGTKSFPGGPIPLAAFQEHSGAGFGFNLDLVRFGSQIDVTIANVGPHARAFVATLSEQQVPTLSKHDFHFATSGEQAHFPYGGPRMNDLFEHRGGPRMDPPPGGGPQMVPPLNARAHVGRGADRRPIVDPIVDAREHVFGIGPVTIPGKSDTTIPKDSPLERFRIDPSVEGSFGWKIFTKQLESWDEFIPTRFLVPSTLSDLFLVYDVEVGGRSQRYADAILRGESVDKPFEPVEAKRFDEHAPVRDDNLGRVAPFRFVHRLKRGSRLSVHVVNTSEEPRTFSGAILGRAEFYMDNFIDQTSNPFRERL